MQLGQQAQDSVTGFSGTLTAHARYLTGCDRYEITPPMKADGTFAEPQWFDRGRIVVAGSPPGQERAAA